MASSAPPPPLAGVDAELRARLDAVIADGREVWARFDRVVRGKDFHPFFPADYELVLERVASLRAPGLRFLEWGSATGVITNLAVLDFDSADHRMRLRSVHPGVSVDDVVAATGFELVVPDDVEESRGPSPEESEALDRLDPKGLRHREVGS